MEGMRLAFVLALVAVAAPLAHGAGRPAVHFVDFSPATVSGTGFHARERILVTVGSDKTTMSRRVVSTGRGAFVARFAKPVRRTACDPVFITAVGSRGDRAAWKSPPPQCGALLGP